MDSGRCLKVFLLLMFTVNYLSVCDGLMCYFCEDSSNKDGKNRCQTYIRSMKHYRKKYNEKGQFHTDKFVKNCTGYANLRDDQVHCAILTLKTGSTVRTFLRDCSDGENFYSPEINERFSNMTFDGNQTQCVRPSTDDEYCVTLCNGDNNDFCNGPVLSAAMRSFSAFSVYINILITGWILKFLTI
ncbi:uncharacterized protein LOC127864780 [Dreissena polymorpha]|uniref:Uncharacterized protein n=1 Tax=Dreissena polymorpha TaxID=45954 RepID=A0A9D4SBP2_DREPO|nr:uncharacterized protein LOC127864780 [Dreissena polymorpha]KAH3898183.1 hypothetical protein DPMN_022402 [Dreissena polymorpha]